jgi:hypothetical protein
MPEHRVLAEQEQQRESRILPSVVSLKINGLPREVAPQPGAIMWPKQYSKTPKNTLKPGPEAQNGLRRFPGMPHKCA